MIDARLSVNVVILPSLYFQMFHHAMYINNDNNLCISFMHIYSCAPEFISNGFSLLMRMHSDAPTDLISPVIHHAALPMQPSRRHFVIVFLVVNLVILPNYRTINYDSIFN